MTDYQSWLSQEHDFPVTPIRHRYAILSSPRSGSTLLGESLRALGAGVPMEYLHEDLLPAFRNSGLGRRQATFGDLLTSMEKRRTTPNGTFGVKTHFYQFMNAFSSAVNTAGVAWLRRQGALIRIYRRDHVAQAISNMKAVSSERWHSTDKAKRNFTFSGQPIEYLALMQNLNLIVRDELHWIGFCQTHGLKTLDIAYEDLRDNLRPTLGRVLTHIGLPDTSSELAKAPLRPLADDQSDRMRAAFLAFLTGEQGPGRDPPDD